MKNPQYEAPVDTVQDLLDRNITILVHSDNYEKVRSDILKLNVPEWIEVANMMRYYEEDCCCPASEFASKSFDIGYLCEWVRNYTDICRDPRGIINNEMAKDCYTFNMKYHVDGNFSHALLKSRLDGMLEYNRWNDSKSLIPKQKWWRSKETLPSYPYHGFQTHKDWILNEV